MKLERIKQNGIGDKMRSLASVKCSSVRENTDELFEKKEHKEQTPLS